MNKHRRPVIAGNWKMYNTLDPSRRLVQELAQALSGTAVDAEVIVAPPATALASLAELIKSLPQCTIKLAAQNLFWEDAGAYTGELAGSMIKDAGADYVIIGHSERRQYFGETDTTVNKKTIKALQHRLIPIVCVGETLAEREEGGLNAVIERQVTASLANITRSDLASIIIAYEPVWAIGTGKTASAAEAEEVHALIRKLIHQTCSADVADQMRIIYGGSVKADNSAELLRQPNIDGALVGGASLKAADFAAIINSCS